jgi:uncharacterized protein YkwD
MIKLLLFFLIGTQSFGIAWNRDQGHEMICTNGVSWDLFFYAPSQVDVLNQLLNVQFSFYDTEKYVLQFINHEREKVGLTPYVRVDNHQGACLFQAIVAFNHEWYQHTYQEGNICNDMEYRQMYWDDYISIPSQEILCQIRGDTDLLDNNDRYIARRFVELWMGSPEHKKVLLDKSYRYCSYMVGIYIRSHTVMVFCTMICWTPYRDSNGRWR